MNTIGHTHSTHVLRTPRRHTMSPTPPPPPLIRIRPGNLQSSPAIEAWVHRKLTGPCKRYGHRMTAVEVHFEDLCGLRHGSATFRCVMEARVNGHLPIAVQARARDLYGAIDAAARKMEAAIARVVERGDARARRRFLQERAHADAEPDAPATEVQRNHTPIPEAATD